MIRTAVLLSFVAALGCAATTDDTESEGSARTGAQTDVFYIVERRESVKGVNLQSTVCADQRSRAACRVADVAWDGAGSAAESLTDSILKNFARGSVLAGNAIARGRLIPSGASATLLLSEAYVGQTYGQPSGTFYLATCTNDCAQWSLRRLNAPPGETAISVPAPARLDGQTDADVARVARALRAGGAVATGTIEGSGRTFKPTTFYLK
jgi:hypothetical protein